MKTLVYVGTFKITRVLDDIRAAFPALWNAHPLPGIPVNFKTDVRVEGDSSGMRITVPDSVSDASINSIVAAHDPNRDSIAESKEKSRRANITSARTKFTNLGFTAAEIDTIF